MRRPTLASAPEGPSTGSSWIQPLVGLWSAWRFLTRLPLPTALAGDWRGMDQALAWFPVVGLMLGGLLVGADALLRFVLTAPVVAVLDVVLLAALTGALHLDGLADTCDAVFAPTTPERRLEIMRDPRIGTFGAVGVASVLLLKAAAIGSLGDGQRPWALLLAPVVGRWAIALCVTEFPYGRGEGMGSPLKAHANGRILLAATLVPVLVAVLAGPGACAAFAVVAACTWLLGMGLMRQIPGLTGDSYGAACELAETVALVAAGALLTGGWQIGPG